MKSLLIKFDYHKGEMLMDSHQFMKKIREKEDWFLKMSFKNNFYSFKELHGVSGEVRHGKLVQSSLFD